CFERPREFAADIAGGEVAPERPDLHADGFSPCLVDPDGERCLLTEDVPVEDDDDLVRAAEWHRSDRVQLPGREARIEADSSAGEDTGGDGDDRRPRFDRAGVRFYRYASAGPADAPHRRRELDLQIGAEGGDEGADPARDRHILVGLVVTSIIECRGVLRIGGGVGSDPPFVEWCPATAGIDDARNRLVSTLLADRHNGRVRADPEADRFRQLGIASPPAFL